MNTNRTKQLIIIRPEVSTTEALSSDESFQNQTLRPILKFQHDVLILAFSHHIQKLKINLGKMDLPDQKKTVEKLVQKDVALRHQLTGMIIGLFSTEEFDFFQKNDGEIRKRIGTLIIQRIQSTLPAA